MAGVNKLVDALTKERVASLLQAATLSKALAGSDRRKMGDYYTSFMDEKTIEAKGLKPLQATLQAIAAIADRKALSRNFGTSLYTANLFAFSLGPDPDNPGFYAPGLDQSGLGMPDRSYYLDTTQDMAFIRTQYLDYVKVLLEQAGLPDPERRAAGVVDLETRMAKAQVSREEADDVVKGNNHWSRSDFGQRAPGLDWESLFAAAGLGRVESFVVGQPSTFTEISALAISVPLETWKDYLAFHALQHRWQELPKGVFAPSVYFYWRIMEGRMGTSPRWYLAVDQTNHDLADLVGKAYVSQYFPPAEKARAEKMVANLFAAFRVRIESLEWLSPATKAKTLEKLNILKVGVGYPDHWQDYRGLRIVAGDAFGNARRAEHFQYMKKLRKIGRSVDRSEWPKPAQTVNAFNLQNLNALIIPAGMLQPPFFDPHRPAAMDYGAMGSVIGHEISHSFDNSGALFDARGKLDNGWRPEELSHFQASGNRLVQQYDAYQPLPDVHVNGRLTQGENIADLAGLAVAYDAYHLSLHDQPAAMGQGFTGDQLFFISFAQSWREDRSESALRNLILTDTHAPVAYRVDTVRNFDAWYTAFQVKPGQALYLAPADRIRIW